MSTASRRYYLRGLRSLELGDLDQAIESLASAIDLAPYFIDARLAHATALARLGDVARAAQTLRAGLGHARTDPARAALWLSLGEVLTAGGDLAGAADAFDQAALHPAYGRRASAGRARAYAKSGRSSDAIASLLRAAGRTALVLVAFTAVAGCKGDDKPAETPTSTVAQPTPPAKPGQPTIAADPVAGVPPPSITPERRALAERVLGHMEGIAAAGDASQGNCPAAAAAMKAVMDKARPDIEAMDKMKSDSLDKSARAWFEKAYGPRMMAVMSKVIGVANKCKDDPVFKAAMANSPFARKKSEADVAAAKGAAPATGTAPATGAAPAKTAPPTKTEPATTKVEQTK